MSVGLARMSNTIDVLQGQEFADYRFAKFPTSDAWGIDTNGDGLPDRVRDFSDYPSRNWQEEVMRTGIIQSYNIGVASGGSAKTKVAASAGYLNQEGHRQEEPDGTFHGPHPFRQRPQQAVHHRRYDQLLPTS